MILLLPFKILVNALKTTKCELLQKKLFNFFYLLADSV